MFNKLKEFIAPDYEGEEYETENEKVLGKVKIYLAEPREFNSVDVIGTKAKQNFAIIFNTRKMSDIDSQRSIDFLSGIIFALNGSIHLIGDSSYLLAPKDISVEGLIEELKMREDLGNVQF